ncbi:translation elongation factor 4 [Allorhodopirellula solitaria]|uniref:Elongation factor 4 n=1 Tax=Allorhodopirellula solitaria TaxID=2527987 RepID=A0A5C5XAL8_9BACT|nr:translation elongation factor 4 [Allorhodopirellula solitaria]TWT59225.1 Elongation factor 4 [Allorhodopirellula solitaria]
MASLPSVETKYIRNFCIIAHIDHGKSTLADRLLEETGAVTSREMKSQLLDDLALERQRGITIKARAVAMPFQRDGIDYQLNLIDTPGHVDFQYEVSRSLACCEGALLLVDAFQGVEAQTMANAFAAMEHDLTIVPVINKIDLVHARSDEVAEEMMNSLGTDPDECVRVSAKTGQGVAGLLDAIIDRIPPPTGDPGGALQAMVFDSNYDDFRGAITYIRVMQGTVRTGQKIRFLRAESEHEVVELGQFAPSRVACDELAAGQVGYLICNIKSLGDVHIGDTVTVPGKHSAEALPGYDQPRPMVYCGLFPSDGQEFSDLRDALERLAVNDPSFEFEPETSDALGFGFRCGFLGLLHMEIIQQRLENESDIDLVQTAPNVTYEIITKKGETLMIHKPQDVPDPGEIDEFRQPIVKCNVIVPEDYIGAVIQLCQERRGIQRNQEYLGAGRAMLTYNIPLAEVIYDLHDRIKSCTRGYGTLDYEIVGYEAADLSRLDILVNGNRVDALSVVCHRADADRRGRAVAKKLKTEIERHMFEVAVQAAIGSRVIARETVPAMRKNVTAKCYGGDVSRKRKLLQKQKEGKKRMKAIGNVEISQKAFMSVLSSGDD